MRPPRASAALVAHALLSTVALGALVVGARGAAAWGALVLRLAGALLWAPHGYAFVRPGPAVHPYGVVGAVAACADVVHSMLRATAPSARGELWRGAGPDEGAGRDYVRALAYAATLSAGAGSPSFGPTSWGGELVSTGFQVFFAVASAVGVAKLISAWVLAGRGAPLLERADVAQA